MNSKLRNVLTFFLMVLPAYADDHFEQKVTSTNAHLGRNLAISGSRVVTIPLDPYQPHTNRHVITMERGEAGWRITDVLSGEPTYETGYMELFEHELFFAVKEHLRPFVRIAGGEWGRTSVIGFDRPPENFSVNTFKVTRDRIAAIGAGYREVPKIHIIERWGANWTKKKELPPTDDRSYLYDIALSGDKLMAAEQYVEDGKRFSRVHIFDLAADYARVTLESPALSPIDTIANELAIAGDWALVSYPGARFTNGMGAVYAYRFERSRRGWKLEQEIRPDRPMFDGFASSMAVDGRRLLVGAPYRHETQFKSGAAFLFELADTTWSEPPRWYERKKFVASDARTGDEFGLEVALSGDTYVVGAPGNKSAIYIYEELVRMQTQRTAKGLRLLWPAKYQKSRLQVSEVVDGPWRTIHPARWSETGNWVVDRELSAQGEYYRVVRE